LSERGGDDAVRVPIEIKTEDLEEIQQLIQELTEAEENIRKAKTEEKKVHCQEEVKHSQMK